MRQSVYEILAALPEPRQGRVWPVKDTRWSFERAVEGAGLDAEPGLRWHDLRQHFASWFMMRGGDLVALQRIRGHATITMTLRYAHMADHHIRSQMEKTERRAILHSTTDSTTAVQPASIRSDRSPSA